MKKLLLTSILLQWFLFGMANMASPIWEGSHAASAITSRDIAVLREKIYIRLDSLFKTATYTIEYHVHTPLQGRQIPLLFYAQDFLDQFEMTIDGKPATLLPIPVPYTSSDTGLLGRLQPHMDEDNTDPGAGTISISWESGHGTVYRLQDLHYVEADLSPGNHIIRISYRGSAWVDVAAWVKKYSFRYSLSPARYWKSFGSLEITLDAGAFAKKWTSNLNEKAAKTNGRSTTWTFSSLPDDFISINYHPEIGLAAQALTGLGPLGMSALMALPLIALHLWAIRKYRVSHPAKRFNSVMIAGSIFLPMLYISFFMGSFQLIDAAIGPEAGKYHGYTFLAFLSYPVLLAVYWLLMWWWDLRVKNKVKKTA